MYDLKLKREHLFVGRKRVYAENTNYSVPEPSEVQMAYEWFIAENILME